MRSRQSLDFRGATLANFYMFRERYPDAKLINLSENYRSTKNILDASYALISNNPHHEKILGEENALKKNTNLLKPSILII